MRSGEEKPCRASLDLDARIDEGIEHIDDEFTTTNISADEHQIDHDDRPVTAIDLESTSSLPIRARRKMGFVKVAKAIRSPSIRPTPSQRNERILETVLEQDALAVAPLARANLM